MLSGRTDNFVWALIGPVVLNLILNVLLIPRFGLMGAVWATILCYGLAFIIALILARRDFPLPVPLKPALQITACCALMAAVVLVVPWPASWPGFVLLFAKAALGACVYLLSCWVTNAANCRNFAQDMLARRRLSLFPEPAE
jgi:O-antigen/teichoic acid export membrane protein